MEFKKENRRLNMPALSGIPVDKILKDKSVEQIFNDVNDMVNDIYELSDADKITEIADLLKEKEFLTNAVEYLKDRLATAQK
jgi:hypothetical protein